MNVPLGQVIQWLENRAFVGAHCPACERRAQIYPWNLRDTWVDVVKQVCRDPREWVMLADYAEKKVQNSALVRHWGLIERSPGRREDGFPSTGYYRMTDLGRQFLKGEVSVPLKMRTFLGKFFDFPNPDERVYVQDVLPYRFNFDSFMRGEG